jgi:hypothetical protein
MENSNGITHMGRDYCPHCNNPVDVATSYEDTTSIPVPGDVSVCYHCTEFLIYESDMALGLLSRDEFYNLDEETQKILVGARQAIQQVKNKEDE